MWGNMEKSFDVICVDAQYTALLEGGKYKITQVYKNYYNVVDESGIFCGSYLSRRFITLSDARDNKLENLLKVSMDDND